MSDPAKTPAEIEDVLASIRRLVSDHDTMSAAATATAEDRPPEAEMPAPPEVALDDEQIDTDAAERLVLTPSQRISEADDPWSPVAEAEQDATPEEAGETDLLDTVARATAEGEASDIPAEIADDSEWKPDDRLMDYAAASSVDTASDDVSPPEAPREADDTAGDALVEASEDEVANAEDVADLALLDGMAPTISNFESETGDDNWPSESAETALVTLVARRDPIRAVPATPSDPEPQAAPDVAEQASSEESQTSDDHSAPVEMEVADVDAPGDAIGMAAPAPAPEDEIETPQPEATQSDIPEDGPHAEDGSDSDTPETDEAKTDDDPATDAPDLEAEAVDQGAEHDPIQKAVAGAATVPDTNADESVPVTPVFSRQRQRAAPASEHGPAMASAASQKPTANTTTATIFDADGGVLDEETLRDIIVDVVREELQGVLGQRITRNVRKMVRREIRLALAAEDLE